jgi:type I restriction enzyme, S subunit
MLTFPRHDGYKDSDVPWIGVIPGHWELGRLRHATESCINGVWGDEPENSSADITCIRVADFTRHDFRVSLEKETKRKISKYDYASRKLECGDLLLEKSGGGDKQLVGQVVSFELDIRAVCSNFIARMRISPKFNSRFMAYYHSFLYGIGINYKHIKQTTGIQNLDSNSYLTEWLVYPSLHEQERIAAFLDEKTAAIDDAIAKKRRLIELLQEQKGILINTAVTQGLDPNVPMKESGVEWIGRVPAHWETSRSKWMFTARNERARPDDEQLSATQAYGVISQQEYMRREGRKVTQITQHLEKRRHVEVDDFVISMRSFQGGLERAWATGCIRSSYVVLQPSLQINPDFFAYLFKSYRYIQALRTTSNFIRDGQDLNFNNFALVDLPVIPLEEQAAIASYLDEITADLAKASEIIQREINLLSEYRICLISETVTGRIKV